MEIVPIRKRVLTRNNPGAQTDANRPVENIEFYVNGRYLIRTYQVDTNCNSIHVLCAGSFSIDEVFRLKTSLL